MGSEDRVTAAFRAVPRANFLPPGERGRAAYDGPIAIGHGQTNSQPRTVADMLRLLDVRPGQRVLDVGAGSGWTTALLAWIVGPEGSVLGLERVASLAEFGAANLAAAGMPWARLTLADPVALGATDHAPFDRILVSAEPKTLPHSLVEQLRGDGVMVIPVAGRMLRVVRTERGHDVTTHGHYRFVPLITDG
ncbi:Protein-L-isoaspartate O-methyltransferase [Nostocoides australiense Ben110]|uniref:Protein-L-isoaspartate O-methyltransferase n=1 Tax=Nostocoides australiense Ben110 TaxID=1193182 RepID=W6JYU0_9MICO|nr:protein-L-isoaspartate O-methyltransferase [Tetrasphaera australiensis]CCH74307.1 Protein-L-isoaspartate O-methyltransferase [Tetrasphaera australiensis Ben110]